ncbi:acyltransferase [Mycoplasmatota bacterium WC30]
MGYNTQIFHDVTFGSEPYLVKLGNNVKITNNVHFITHDGGIHVFRTQGKLVDGDVFGRIVLGDNIFVGNNVCFLPGITIGNNCVIGTGSIVTKSFPSNVVIAGIPAKIVKTLDEYYSKINSKAIPTKGMSPKEKKEYITTNL